jgi:type II secretory pathway component GspD/PulD (secretin)
MRTLLAASAILVALAAFAPAARGDDRIDRRELCGRNVRHHGAPIDLNVKDADIHDVFRLIADVARVNLVIPADVTGKVTVRLLRVAWDAAACAIAGVHRLTITVDGNILLVMRAR